MDTTARLIALLGVACANHVATPAPATPTPTSTSTFHDPDHARGPLPDAKTRRLELGVVRKSLDTMYAHRLAKVQRYAIDEDALFTETETRLVAADSWAAYDAAIYNALAKFHDGHLTYHPPQTAAPARGYQSFHLGLATVFSHDHLLVESVEPGGEVAAAAVSPGDEVIEIDGRLVAHTVAALVASRAASRPESSKASFAKTWTAVLTPKGDAPRARSIRVRKRDGTELGVSITPREVPKVKHEAVSIAIEGDVAVVTIRTLDGNKERARAIDDALAKARDQKGIVIDLRGDRGGIDLVGYRVVADLAEGTARLGTYRVMAAPQTLALRPRWKHLVAGPDGFTAPQELTVPALVHGYRGRVAVVVDAGCVSTCEVVSAALRANLHAVIVGQVTGGSSGAPVEVSLPASHANIAIPTWDLLSADGHPIEDDGVTPDLDAVPTADALAAGEDAPVRQAIAQVRAP